MQAAERLLTSCIVLAALALGGVSSAGAASALPIHSAAVRKPPMNAKPECGTNNFSRTQCMIRMILDDLQANYQGEAAGGISAIKANSSTSYTVSLPKEERVQKYTYVFEFGPDGTPVIKSKTESVESHGQ